MNRLIMTSGLALGLAATSAVASPLGTDISVNVVLQSANNDWDIVDTFEPFDWAIHTLGGPGTLLIANYDFVTDVLVTSSVSTIGNIRTIQIDFFSVTGGNIFQDGHEAFLDQSDLYWLTFYAFQIEDAERASLVSYAYYLRDVAGNDVLGETEFDGFFGGFGYLDSPSLASSDFFGIAVNGFTLSMTYAIPAPGSIAALALAGFATRRRR